MPQAGGDRLRVRGVTVSAGPAARTGRDGSRGERPLRGRRGTGNGFKPGDNEGTSVHTRGEAGWGWSPLSTQARPEPSVEGLCPLPRSEPPRRRGGVWGSVRGGEGGGEGTEGSSGHVPVPPPEGLAPSTEARLPWRTSFSLGGPGEGSLSHVEPRH